MTDEMRKIVLDELNGLNLDLRLKQQFVTDMKLLVDKDVYYWTSRLDVLRCISNTAAVSSPQSQELQRLSRTVAELEKSIASLRDEIHLTSDLQVPSRSNVSETIPEDKQPVNQDKTETANLAGTMFGTQVDAISAARYEMFEEPRANAKKLRQLEDDVSPFIKIIQRIWEKHDEEMKKTSSIEKLN